MPAVLKSLTTVPNCLCHNIEERRNSGVLHLQLATREGSTLADSMMPEQRGHYAHGSEYGSPQNTAPLH